MFKRSLHLRTDRDFQKALMAKYIVKIIQSGEDCGEGVIYQFDSDEVIILDTESQNPAHFFRSACEFYAER